LTFQASPFRSSDGISQPPVFDLEPTQAVEGGGGLHARKTEDRERVADDGVGLEGAMSEEALKSHRDPDSGQHVAGDQNRKLRRTHHPIPEQSDREHEPGRRRRDSGQVHEFVCAAQLVLAARAPPPRADSPMTRRLNGFPPSTQQ
jgi:hypothetical protein